MCLFWYSDSVKMSLIILMYSEVSNRYFDVPLPSKHFSIGVVEWVVWGILQQARLYFLLA